MKILVYSDVHGNKDALENLLQSEDYKNADKRIFLGDAVSFCPYPNECIEILKTSGDILLMGNHDYYCTFGISDDEKQNFNKEFLIHLDYIRNIVTSENKEFLKNLNQDLELKINDKKLYFTHFLWETNENLANNPDGRNKPSNLTAEIFDKKIDADYILFGHNHTPNKIEMNNKTFVCVGSLGVRSPANYIIIKTENNEIKIEQKQLNYNYKKVINDMKTLNYPSAKVFTNFFSEN